MADDAKGPPTPAAQTETPDATASERSAARTDKLASGLERLAYKLHDFGNWLLGFIR